jgi:glycosyltransferase involved in cell wall biosynthesis
LLRERPAILFPANVDAIIVPTIRKATTLRPAIELAARLGSTLVVLCSGRWSSVHEVVALAKDRVKLVAIDVDRLPDGVIPTFKTCKVLESTRFERKTDTSLKRNLGLLLARLIGWQRIVFLDDDITVPEPMDLREAAGLTDHFAGVGLAIDEVNGMPDNSVVCHAFRAAGGAQDMFIGGGALAIGQQSMDSFFPNIYNEDWFFLLDDDGLRSTTIMGTAIQEPYDPFREERARKEELGDSLAEGLFWLLDHGKSLQQATVRHWQKFLHERAGFITDVIGMVERMGGDLERRRRMLLSLKAARGRCQSIEPDLCVRYLDAWRSDRVIWRNHLDSVHHLLVTRKNRSDRERRSRAGVRDMLRSLDFPAQIVRLHVPFPSKRLHHDSADFDVAYPVAVGQ